MENILKELCTRAKLELVYTNNKITLLSSGTENNLPTIRVHKIFKNCDEKVANAVIKYYTDYIRNKEYIKTINDYLIKYYDVEQYKIKPPSELFKALVAENYGAIKPAINQEENLIESNISSDDLMELDIIVNHFNT